MRFAFSSLATLIVGATCIAQSNPNQLDQTRLLANVAAQKLEADTRLAMVEADRLMSSDAAKAAAKLKDAIAALDSDQYLPEHKKKTLIRVLRDRLRIAEAGPPSQEERDALEKADESHRAAAKADAERQATETKSVKEGITQAVRLRKDGKSAEAEKAIAKLAQEFPDNFSLQLLTGRAGLEKSLKETEKLTKDNEQAYVSALRDVEKSAMPALSDMEFPKDWKERTAKRRDLTAPNEAEIRLLKSLETPIEFRYQNSRLQDVLDHLQTSMNRTIITDASALSEVNATYDTPITFSAREPLAARTGLRAVLSQLNLTYVVRDGVIHVTTPARARDLMITKVYYLGDLILGIGPAGGTPTVGLLLDQVQLLNNITALVEMLQGAIEPTSWERKGGLGHLGFNVPTLSLTVRQSQEVHVMLRASLYGKK